jgi:hypothetical protein
VLNKLTTILYWIRNFAIKTYDKPRPQGAVIVDFDEMWLYTVEKNVGYGRLIIALPVNLWTGNVGIVAKRL